VHPARTLARRARRSLARWRLLAYYRGRYLVARRSGAPAVCLGTPGGTELPHFYHVAWKVCHLLGLPIRPLTAARPGDIRWAWLDATTNDPVPGAINGDCIDISKSRVDAAMRQVFGYGAEIDPTTHEGICVRKSEENHAHDGRIVQCPTEPEPGYVYQRLIDTQVGHEAEDLRVVKLGSRVPLVYRFRRDLADRFLDTDNSAVAIDPVAAFTDEELARLVATSDVIGLDVGELDVLRDNADGRIYVVDINKTPAGPPRAMSWPAKKRAARTLAEAYRDLPGWPGPRGTNDWTVDPDLLAPKPEFDPPRRRRTHARLHHQARGTWSARWGSPRSVHPGRCAINGFVLASSSVARRDRFV
jgi:hypothetical protein